MAKDVINLFDIEIDTSKAQQQIDEVKKKAKNIPPVEIPVKVKKPKIPKIPPPDPIEIPVDIDDAPAKKSLDDLSGLIGKVGIAAAGAFATGAVIDFASEVLNARQSTQLLFGDSVADIDKFNGRLLATANVFNVDIVEAQKSVNALQENFGLTAEQALKKYQNGIAQLGPLNDDLNTQIQEYSTQLVNAGLNADDMFSIIQRGNQGGVFDDKALDSIKEAGIRFRELPESTRDALEGIGIDADQLAADLAAGVEGGGKSIFDAIQEVSGALGELPDQSAAVGTAIADGFGGAGEDAGLAFLRSLQDIKVGEEFVIEESNNLAKAQLALANIQGSLIGGFSGLADSILALTAPLLEPLAGVVEFLSENIEAFIPVVLGLVTALGVALVPAIASATAAWVAANLAFIATPIGAIITGVILLTTGLILLVKNIDWVTEALADAWDWIKNKIIPVLADAAAFWLKWLNPIGLLVTGLTALFELIKPWIDENFPALGAVIDTITGFFGDLAGAVKDGFVAIGNFLGILGDETEDLGEKTKKTKDETDELTKSQKETAKAADAAAKAAENENKKLKTLGTTTKETAKSLSDLKKEYLALESPTKAAFDNLVGLTKETGELKLRTDDLNKSLQQQAGLLDDAAAAKALTARGAAAKKQAEFRKADEKEKSDEKAKARKALDDEDGANARTLKERKDQEAADEATFIEQRKEMINELAGDTGFALGQVLAEGSVTFEKLGNVALGALADTVSSAILLYTPEILAAFTALLGPFGIPAGFAAIGLIQGLLSVAKSKISGAEQGTDFGKPLSAHNAPIGRTDTNLLAVSDYELQHGGVLGRSALEKGGAFATNREVAQSMQSGQPAERLILERMFQNGLFDRDARQDSGKTEGILLQLLDETKTTNSKLKGGLIQEFKNWKVNSTNNVVNEVKQVALYR